MTIKFTTKDIEKQINKNISDARDYLVKYRHDSQKLIQLSEFGVEELPVVTMQRKLDWVNQESS